MPAGGEGDVPTDAKDLIHSGCHYKPRYSLNKTFAAPHHLSWLRPWQILGSLSKAGLLVS